MAIDKHWQRIIVFLMFPVIIIIFIIIIIIIFIIIAVGVINLLSYIK